LCDIEYETESAKGLFLNVLLVVVSSWTVECRNDVEIYDHWCRCLGQATFAGCRVGPTVYVCAITVDRIFIIDEQVTQMQMHYKMVQI